MERFTEIEQFRHMVKKVERLYRYEQIGEEWVYNYKLPVPKLSFTGTCKLHGTNAGIHRKDHKITYQSRNNEITVEEDNIGFARFISEIPEFLVHYLFDEISIKEKDEVVIFGEWIGPRIQGGCGINLLPEKQFVIFGAKLNGEYVKNKIDLCLQEHRIYNILDIPSYHITIDFDNLPSMSNLISDMVDKVDKECPWALKFGHKGFGEGIVFTCDEFPNNESLWFKSKGTSHKGGNGKKRTVVEIDPIVQKSIDDFVEYAVTLGRLDQGVEYLTEQHLEIEMKSIGKFLQWIAKDINKEEYDTLEASDLTWKEVAKGVNNKAKRWFIVYINDNF